MHCLCSSTSLIPCPLHNVDDVTKLSVISQETVDELDFSALNSLRIVDLSRNGLLEPLPPARFFNSGSSLRSITYSRNRLTSLGNLGHLPTLRVLKLSFNSLTSISLLKLVQLVPNVEQLWLDHNKLCNLVTCTHTLSQFRQLKHLVLFPNGGFTEEELELGWKFCASALPRLHSLDGLRLAAFNRRRSQGEILKTKLWRKWCRLTSSGPRRTKGAHKQSGRGERRRTLAVLGEASADNVATGAVTAVTAVAPSSAPLAAKEKNKTGTEKENVSNAIAKDGDKKRKKNRTSRKGGGKENAPAQEDNKQSNLMQAVGAVRKWNKRMSLSELLQAL